MCHWHWNAVSKMRHLFVETSMDLFVSEQIHGDGIVRWMTFCRMKYLYAIQNRLCSIYATLDALKVNFEYEDVKLIGTIYYKDDDYLVIKFLSS
jgi:hypothetical protein